MNFSLVFDKLSAARIRTRFSACTAILLLQLNLAYAVEPPQQQAPPADTQQAQPAPDAPSAASSGTPTPQPTLGQQMQNAQRQPVATPKPFHVDLPRSHNPLSPYMPSTVPELDLTNSPRLQSLIRDGKLYISLKDAIALAIENNLDLASFRYNFPIAQTDYQSTKAGSPVRGVDTSIVQASSQGGFSGGGGGGGGGGASAAGAGGLVTSTLGAGTAVPSFDPYLNFRGVVDHNTQQEPNQAQTGVPIFKQNTIQVLVFCASTSGRKERRPVFMSMPV